MTRRSQFDVLLDGGAAALRAQLAALRCAPIVVDPWGARRRPYRFEFPFFQPLSSCYGGRAAFIPYPSCFEQDASAARIFRGGQAWPTTAFDDRDGRLVFTDIGAYATESRLDADIRRYALDG